MCDLLQCSASDSDKPLPEVSDDMRRLFLKGLAALPLASVLAYPELARAAGAKTTPVKLPLSSGGMAEGVIAMPKTLPAPTIILIHEWWGLNDQIKSVAADMADKGYIALAVDLYHGEVATSREEANAYRLNVKGSQATSELSAVYHYLSGHESGTGKVGVMGWCFGGGWSLNTALAVPVDACIVYYGNVAKTADELQALSAPVLGHFGTLDKHINKDMVDGFEKAAKAAGKSELLTLHWYEADHAFANPTGSRFDADDAQLSWERTMAFLEQHLRA